MDFGMIILKRPGYDRRISFDVDRPNNFMISSPTDDIVFNLEEGEKLYKFLKGVYEDEPGED